MKHHLKRRKLGRTSSQRKALLESLAEALILHERIETTEAKAKELRPFIEKMITKAKNDTLSVRRLVISRLGGRTKAAKKLVEEIAPRYKDRPGGYTRVIKLSPRETDASPRALIELVEAKTADKKEDKDSK